jgi:hypothetical protein
MATEVGPPPHGQPRRNVIIRSENRQGTRGHAVVLHGR